MREIDLSVNDAMKSATFKVNLKGVKVLKVRLWIGKCLFMLAAVIMGAGIKFDGVDGDET